MPKGGASSLTPVYAGLREDLDSFLKAYLQLDSVRFSEYKKMFQHRGMIRIFNGRSNSAEIIEFNECLLIHCLPYMEEQICPGVPRSIKERLFGLYSLYTFFYVQQENHVVKVRMDPDAVRNFTKLTELLLELKIYDAYMACLKLLEDKAIKHVAFIAIHDPANFKRFYTDEKVSGVALRTNLNDPLGNVKALVDSDLFNKLGIMRREYKKLKEKAKFIGNPLEDVQEKIREIIVQYTEEFETLQGVDEIINTDHSFEQLASRGMLRTSIKEHAHSADLKLARYRRHRSVTPLEMPIDNFDYTEGEFVPEIKDVKPIKAESSDPSSEPPVKRRSKRNTRYRAAKPDPSVDVPEETVSEGIVAVQPFRAPKPEPPDSHENESGMDSLMEAVSLVLADTEDRALGEPPTKTRRRRVQKKEPGESKPNNFHLDAIVNSLEPINKFNERNSTQQPIEIEQPSSEMNGVQLYVDCSEAVPATAPKSIIKTRKADTKRKVSFRFNEDGDVDTTVFEIPTRAMEAASKSRMRKSKKQAVETIVFEIPEPEKVVEKPHEPIIPDLQFDDADMFRPLEGEEETDLGFDAFGMESDLELAIDEDDI